MAANTNRGLVAPITEEQIAYFDTPHFDISAYFEVALKVFVAAGTTGDAVHPYGSERSRRMVHPVRVPLNRPP